MTDPLHALWRRDGAPPLDHPKTIDGVCAVTGATEPVIPLKQGLQSSFASQHLLTHTGPAAGVSAAMWHAMNRWGPVRCATSRWKDSGLIALVIDDDVIEVTKWDDDHENTAWLVDHLAELAGAAIVAPSTRKKHSTLWASNGCVATEQGPEPIQRWLAPAVTAARDAKAAGVTEGELGEPEPTFRAVGLVGGITAAQALWRTTSPLRARPHLLSIALIWGRQPKPKEQ